MTVVFGNNYLKWPLQGSWVQEFGESFLKPKQAAEKSKTAETAQIQTGQEILLGLQLTPSRSLLLNCHRNTAHTELSHWTLLLLRFAIDTTPTELSQQK